MIPPNALPEPTAPQDGEPMNVTEWLHSLASDLRHFASGGNFSEDTARCYADDALGYASRLSSLSTELVRVRGALEQILAEHGGSCNGKDRCPSCIAFMALNHGALGGLVPPDASPRRTE